MGKKKKIQILGAGYEQVPAIQMAKEMGYFVISTDINPDAPGFKCSDASFIVSTNDFEGNLKIAVNEKIDGILTLISETAVPVLAKICAKLNLPGYDEDVAFKATNKLAMHKAMDAMNVKMPKFACAQNEKQFLKVIENIPLPFVVKPTDSSGQRGITLVNEMSQARWAFFEAHKYAGDNTVIIEEFIEGKEINVTTIVINGDVKVLSLSERVTLRKQKFGVANEHLSPPEISPEMSNQISLMAEMSSKALGIKNGITYPQIIAGENGPVLLEIAVRIPGGKMRELAFYRSGIDLIKVAILQSTNNFYYEKTHSSNKYKGVLVFHYTSLDIGDADKFHKVSGVEDALKIQGVKQFDCNLVPGDFYPNLSWSGSRFASLVIASESVDKCKRIFNNVYSKIKFM